MDKRIAGSGARERSSRSKRHFSVTYRRFNNSTPKTYPRVSLEICRLLHGPEFPEKAFASLDALQEWYRAIRDRWLCDSLAIADYWRERLPSNEHELALSHVVLEARNTGVRRIQRRVFREQDGIPQPIRIASYSELSKWCGFMFELLADDDQYVDQERQCLTIRYDKGVAYRIEEDRKDAAAEHGEWAAAMTYSVMKGLSQAEPRKVEPDDDWLLVIWGKLANASQSIREATVSLFVDSQPRPKRPHAQLLEEIISVTWQAMRQLGPVCRSEPNARSPKQVRKHLDEVKTFCDRQESPKNASARNGLGRWAGGERATLAIAITDVVGSTRLARMLRDEDMNYVRQAHFTQTRKLIRRFKGREVKTTGDGIMVVFRSADAALDFAIALQEDTGDERIRIRAGIHIGPMRVEEGDIFGDTVNFASRVIETYRPAGIRLSDQAKKDIDDLGAKRHMELAWTQREGVRMKGLPGTYTLWSLRKQW